MANYWICGSLTPAEKLTSVLHTWRVNKCFCVNADKSESVKASIADLQTKQKDLHKGNNAELYVHRA